MTNGKGPMNTPWYRGGLRFECTRCGHCCTGEPGFVWVNEDDIARIATFCCEPLDEVRGLYVRRAGRRLSLREKGSGDCVFFDRTAGCTIYPVRPTQCRTWPFWDANTATPEAWEETGRRCPGAGHGPLISAEEITRRIDAIRVSTPPAAGAPAAPKS